MARPASREGCTDGSAVRRSSKDSFAPTAAAAPRTASVPCRPREGDDTAYRYAAPVTVASTRGGRDAPSSPARGHHRGGVPGRSAGGVPDLLDGPGVAVRVVEVDEGAVVGAVGLHARGHLPVQEVLRAAVVDAALLQHRVGLLDVVHDQVRALERPRRDAAAEPGAEDDRAG